MKPFQFLTIRPALIIGVQFKLQNLYYFGLSATNFPSLDVKILTTSVWVRHLFPHWTCRRVEEISNAPRVRNTLVYSSREDLEIFGSSEIGLLSRVWGLCALQCDPVSSTWAGMSRSVYQKTPGERQDYYPSSLSRSWSLCLWVSCHVFPDWCWWAPHGPNIGRNHMSLRGVNITWLWTGWCHPDSPVPHFTDLTRVSCHSSCLARTWSWCRPKKEDWLKKKDRNHWRPGCRRAPVPLAAPVSSCSGPGCRQSSPVPPPRCPVSSCSGPGHRSFLSLRVFVSVSRFLSHHKSSLINRDEWLLSFSPLASEC